MTDNGVSFQSRRYTKALHRLANRHSIKRLGELSASSKYAKAPRRLPQKKATEGVAERFLAAPSSKSQSTHYKPTATSRPACVNPLLKDFVEVAAALSPCLELSLRFFHHMREISLKQKGAVDRDVIPLDKAAFIPLNPSGGRSVFVDIKANFRRGFSLDTFTVFGAV